MTCVMHPAQPHQTSTVNTCMMQKLRIHSPIRASKIIFDSRVKKENICSQLSKLGLVLLKGQLLKLLQTCMSFFLLLNSKEDRMENGSMKSAIVRLLSLLTVAS